MIIIFGKKVSGNLIGLKKPLEYRDEGLSVNIDFEKYVPRPKEHISVGNYHVLYFPEKAEMETFLKSNVIFPEMVEEKIWRIGDAYLLKIPLDGYERNLDLVKKYAPERYETVKNMCEEYGKTDFPYYDYEEGKVVIGYEKIFVLSEKVR